MVEKWNSEDYFAAGEAFGNFWTAMIGMPSSQEVNVVPMSKHPVADYYSAGFIELWN